MLINPELNQAINAQIGHEMGAHLQYLSIAAYFDCQHLELLAKLYFKQADEENAHALKLVHYILDTQGELRLPAIPAPEPSFASAQAAAQAALAWETEVTGQINQLMAIAVAGNDFLAQSFLQWFVDEQLEEMQNAAQILSVIQRSGEKNLLMVEAYLAHLDLKR